MKQRIESYTFTLTTESPVFIGSGVELNKREYIYINKDGGKVIIPNLYKLISFLDKKNLTKDYENYLLNQNTGASIDLYNWLYGKGINSYNYFTDYEIDANGIRPDRAKVGIKLFMKDGQGEAYIPGSSLKGVIRTIWLIDFISENNLINKSEIVDTVRTAKRAGRWNKDLLKREIEKIEANCFNKLNFSEKKNDAVNDFMKGLIIGDSEPISKDAMTLCRKQDVSIKNKPKEINMLRECIKPGTEIKFQITVDNAICDFSPEKFLKMLKKYADIYNECFLSAFDDEISNNVIHLGGGAGFASKTVLYEIFGKETGTSIISDILTLQFSKDSKNKDDVKTGVSPHMEKCTTYKGRLYEFGRCKVSFS